MWNEDLIHSREYSCADETHVGSLHAQGLEIGDFKKIAANGLGEDYNAYPHAMAWFRNKLVVCVTRAVLVVRGRMQTLLHPDKVGDIWPVKLPDNYFDLDLCAQIWSYDPETKEWKKNYTSPLIPGNQGVNVPLCRAFRGCAVFKSKHDPSPALYIPSAATTHKPETVLLKSYDGENFVIISEPGLGIKPVPRALRGLVSFKDRLFTSPVSGQKQFEHNITEHMIILTSDDPENGGWQPACEPNFGNPNNLSVFDMAEFNGCLYAGTGNIVEGFEIWKTDAGGEPPFLWKRILAKGAYRGKLNQGAITLHQFGNHLYVGTGIQGGGWDIDNNTGPAAAELIRIGKDDSWDLIVGEPRQTPEGLKVPLSGLGSGFMDLTAGYLWSMCSHKGYLYAGNFKWFTHTKFADPEKLPVWLRDPMRLEKLLKNFGGCGLWRTRDGWRWQPVTLNGFGNCYNFGIRNMVSSPYGLFVGTANPYTPEVAVKRFAGWKYENNYKGGVEIWLGTKDPERDRIRPENFPHVISRAGKSGDSGKRMYGEGDDAGLEKLMSDFFQESGFRHFGLWRPDVENIKDACEDLMAEVLAYIDEKKGSILDVDCGLGATTGCLHRFFHGGGVTGITIKKKFVPLCRQKAPRSQILYRRLPKLGVPQNSVDNAIWIKGLQSTCDSQKLLTEIFSVLKPGGKLICFDLLLHPHKKRGWRNFLSRADAAGQVGENGDHFAAAGFRQVEITDVTSRCLPGFRKYRARFLGLERVALRIDERMFAKANRYFFEKEAAVQACLLISACKQP